ncbi:MAG TPA: VIT1/CCC1 transporter family protein [Byssovorax sp.]|jgi:VIT1/CCC1 family predicted Fe2+/Mn2+ transporter
MAKRIHVERHFTGSETVRDVVIGMSDGLTVPFALAAGLSGAVSSNSLVLTAGLSEIAAGSIAMGLGGFLAARSDAEHYDSEEQREHDEVVKKPREEEAEVFEALARYGLTHAEIAPVVAGLKRDKAAWVDFMMRFELGLERPEPRRALTSALTIAGAYVVGGLVPLAPYVFSSSPRAGLVASAAVTLVALAAFGFVKGRYTGARPLLSALQTVVVGSLAAAAAFALARAFT